MFSGAVAIVISAGWELLPALFHSTSALGTVGPNIRSSAELGAFGKLLLIFPMFVGRLGPITFLVALSARSRSRADDYPPGSDRMSRGSDAAGTGSVSLRSSWKEDR